MAKCWQCGLPYPETNPYCFCPEPTIGIDVSSGVETHVEGYWKDGVLNITDSYQIIDGGYTEKEMTDG